MTIETTTIDTHQRKVLAEHEALFWGFVNKNEAVFKQLASKDGLSLDEYLARNKEMIGILAATQDLSAEGLSMWMEALRARIGDGRGWETGTLGRCYMAANPETRQVWLWASGRGWSNHTIPVNWEAEGF
jgi:hypothetical protein